MLRGRGGDGSRTRREFLATSAAAAVGLAGGVSPLAGETARPPQNPATPFPKGFLWGASTSAYQIEGAAREDGKGPSIWDEFCRRPGAIWEAQSGDIACDHYHRYREDVRQMRALGLGAYRFSVSWPRILPAGTGAVNPKGLDFYSRLVDALLDAGVAPFLTLYHWDLPLALQQRGGWRNRDAADWFADYAATLARALADRVPFWLTMNEPRSFIGSGYRNGEHAPGEKLSLAEALHVGHILLLAHGKAVQAIRAHARRPLQVGMAPDASPSMPWSDAPPDVAAARSATFGAPPEYFRPEFWWRSNAWWIDPVFLGAYPAEGMAAAQQDAPEILAGDMETMAQPLDFFAVNIYGGHPVRAGADGKPERLTWPAGFPLSAFDWPITPDALYWGPKWLYERYHLPLYITENGLSCRDWISLDHCVHDPQRIDFMARYLGALQRAMHEGVPVRGYFHWSLLDNFEWAQGYRQRFGLIFVDFATQQRVLKDSAHWYAKLIASHGATLAAASEPCARP